MQPLNSDEDYLNAGVEPPEHNVHLGSEEVAFDRHLHSWTVRGAFLHCERGHHPHGMPFDHLNYMLVGTDRHGEPILKKIDLADEKKDDSSNGADQSQSNAV